MPKRKASAQSARKTAAAKPKQKTAAKKAVSAKKKSTARQPASAKKSAAAGRTSKKKTAQQATVAKQSTAKQSAAKKKTPVGKTARKQVPGSTPADNAAVSLGRPKVTGDKPLHLLFHHDYGAREIFDFLRVRTVKELEVFSPEEIFDQLTRTVRHSVDRIRIELARQNRSLAGDKSFAQEYKALKERARQNDDGRG